MDVNIYTYIIIICKYMNVCMSIYINTYICILQDIVFQRIICY